MSNLRKKTVKGVYWATARTVVTSLIAPLLLIIRAYYLTPKEFGVLSIISVILQLFSVIENFGLSTAIIQKDVVTRDERSSLFFIQIIICGCAALFIVVTSPIMAVIFDMEILVTLLPILSLTIFLQGPIILFTAFLEKEFFFKELSIIQILREITIFSSTFLLLFLDYGLFAVVLSQVIGVIIMVILIMILSFKKNLLHLKFHFDWKDVRPYFKFGITILGKAIVRESTHHIDELIIGYFLSSESLGFYHFAKDTLNRIRSLVTTAFSKVMLPLLSKVKHDDDRLTNAYNRISKYIGVFVFPILVGIALTANLFIPVFFGEEWLGSKNFFIILSIAYIPYLLSAYITPNLLYAVNKPELTVYVEVASSICYISLVFLFSWWGLGIYMIVTLYALYIIGKMTCLQYLVQLQLKTSFKDYLGLFKNILFSIIVMIISLIVIQLSLVDLVSPIFVLIICILSGALSYFATLYLLDKRTLNDIVNIAFNK